MKLLTYSYSQYYDPSMPVVDIKLATPGYNPFEETFLALVDSGADGTLVPIRLLEIVGARYVGQAYLRGITGAALFADVYLVNVCVADYWVRGVRVAASPEDSEIVLGRNVLNHLHITLNGPANMVEILV